MLSKLPDVHVSDVDALKKIFKGEEGQADFYIQLNGAISRKSINYMPHTGLGAKVWDVYHSISDVWEEYDDEGIVSEFHGSDGKFQGLFWERGYERTR